MYETSRAPGSCILILFLGLAAIQTAARAQVAAFPGALGFGANASGGRLGSVYHVTTLADSGPGSFRDAVSQPNRTVVFDVSGYITLASEVAVKSHMTLAGQTAPGGGIGIRGREVSFGGQENIVCRFVRFRPGAGSNGSDNAINLYRAKNVILDHVSIEFGKWNNIGGVSDDWQGHPVTDITVQNCIIGNPIGQQFGAHTECVNGNWSWYYNIFANSHNRNPLAKFNTVFVNNVLYNTQGGYTTHTSTKFKHDIVNNYFIGGPGSGSTDNTWYQVDKNQSIYYSGNLKDRNLDGVLNGALTTPYWYQGPGTILTSPWSSWTTRATVLSPAAAYALTVSSAGALPRDAVDELLISQVKTLGKGPVGTATGTAGPDGSLYSSQAQTGLNNDGFGTLVSGTAVTDTDQDALPDYWESALGFNTTAPDQNLPVPPGAFIPATPAGYTLLDEYLHFLASPHAVLGMNASAEVDLGSYGTGFSVAPVAFNLVNVTHIDATLQPDGHTVQLAPEKDYVGRAQLDFEITDGSGNRMTQSLLILVSGALAVPSAPRDLTAMAISSSQIALSWTDTSPNEVGFTIERSADGLGFSPIRSVDGGVTGFTDVVAPQTTYHYRVRAFSLGGSSAYSNLDSATTPAGPPAVPAFLVATPANSRVVLSWGSSPGAGSYKLKRSVIPGTGYAAIGVTSETEFSDLYAVNGTTYYYVVSSLNEAGESPDSPESRATPLSTVTYPAEDAVYGAGAVFESSNGGFRGTGYVNSAIDGSFLQFNGVDAGGGGRSTLRFRNALGNNARTGLLIVNGVSVPITFAGTGAWTTWVNTDVVVSLNPGAANTIRLVTNGQDLANIDELTVFGTAVTPPPAAPFFDGTVHTDGQLLLSGFGGVPGATFYVLSSQSVEAPILEWTRLVTNRLDGNGAFSISTPLDPAPERLFYQVRLP